MEPMSTKRASRRLSVMTRVKMAARDNINRASRKNTERDFTAPAFFTD